MFRDRNKRLYCEICGFNFKEICGELGEGFIEAHHRKPISEMQEGEKISINDILLVCSNCHSMLHRLKPWASKNDLQEIIEAHRK